MLFNNNPFGWDYPPGVSDRDISKHDNLCDDGSAVCRNCECAFDAELVNDCDECNADDLCEGCMLIHPCVAGVVGGAKTIFNATMVIGSIIIAAGLVWIYV